MCKHKFLYYTRFKSDNFKILARQCILCQQIINVMRRSLFSENMKSLKYKLIITFKGVTTSLVPYMYFSLLNSKNRLKLFVASMWIILLFTSSCSRCSFKDFRKKFISISQNVYYVFIWLLVQDSGARRNKIGLFLIFHTCLEW